MQALRKLSRTENHFQFLKLFSHFLWAYVCFLLISNTLFTLQKLLMWHSSSPCFYPFSIATLIFWILYIHLSFSDRNLSSQIVENGSTLLGKKKGSLPKIKLLASFVDYRKYSSFQFNKHLLSTYLVSSTGKNTKMTPLFLKGTYNLVGKMKHSDN